jgi:cobalt transporter subunit CbtB
MIKAQTQTQSQAVVEVTSSKLPAMVALIFGAFIVLGAGFAQSSTIHDAAHDVRHAFSLPCH